jgi:hypothetical protein
MKTHLHPSRISLPALVHPFDLPALPLFFALAFLPAILHLTPLGLTAASPVAAAGTLAAGFWLAVNLPQIRLRVALLGPALAAALWLANWLMSAEFGCCGGY